MNGCRNKANKRAPKSEQTGICFPAWYLWRIAENYTSPSLASFTVQRRITAVPIIRAIREAVRPHFIREVSVGSKSYGAEYFDVTRPFL